MTNIFLKNLNYLIKKTNLSRQYIADSLCIEISSLTKYLNGTRNLDYEKRAKIADILQMPLNHLESIDYEVVDKEMPISSYSKLNLNSLDLSKDSQILQMLKNEFVFLDNIKGKNKEYLDKLGEVRKFLCNEKSTLDLIETLDYFISYSNETKDFASMVNSLSLILLCWIILKNPSSNLQKEYIKERIESAYDDSAKKGSETLNFKENYYFVCMDLLKSLNKVSEYKDFVSYFIALKCLSNFNYGAPEQSDSEAMAVGANLISELTLIGNKYAINLLKIK